MDKFENKTIGIIGAGHLGKALQEGFLNSGKISKNKIFISNKLHDNNLEVVKNSDLIFIAVKPLIVQGVTSEIKDFIKDKILISVAAGISIKKLREYSQNNKQKIVRAMSNIPVAVNEGVIGVYYNQNTTKQEEEMLTKLFSILGKAIRVEKEADLNTLTIISGCGPAIASYFIESLASYGEINGLSKKKALKTALQTFKGTISYLQNKNLTPGDLIQSVATKGGITEEILSGFKRKGLRQKIKNSLESGYVRLS